VKIKQAMLVGLVVGFASTTAFAWCTEETTTWEVTKTCGDPKWGWGRGYINYGARSLSVMLTTNLHPSVSARGIYPNADRSPTCFALDSTNNGVPVTASPAQGCGACIRFIFQVNDPQ